MADKEEKKSTENEDKELAELLDSALADLTKKPESDEKTELEPLDASGEAAATDLCNVEWTEEFMKQAAAQFETNMAALLSQLPGNTGTVTQDDINSGFQRMAEAAAQVMANPTEASSNPNQDFASAISDTLKGLSEGRENIQAPFSEQDLAQMFMGGDSESNGFLPFMQGMMQSLLSKEVLYPSLKEIIDKYPAWLEENKSKLEESEFERYSKQKNLMETVCAKLETESESDSAEVKKQRFDDVLELMQQMQDLGQPPKDLVGDINTAGLQFDGSSPIMPGMDPNQCLIM